MTPTCSVYIQCILEEGLLVVVLLKILLIHIVDTQSLLLFDSLQNHSPHYRISARCMSVIVDVVPVFVDEDHLELLRINIHAHSLVNRVVKENLLLHQLALVLALSVSSAQIPLLKGVCKLWNVLTGSQPLHQNFGEVFSESGREHLSLVEHAKANDVVKHGQQRLILVVLDLAEHVLLKERKAHPEDDMVGLSLNYQRPKNLNRFIERQLVLLEGPLTLFLLCEAGLLSVRCQPDRLLLASQVEQLDNELLDFIVLDQSDFAECE